MSRKQKLILNTSLSIVYKLISLICAFILPRAILTHFGSAVNGLTQSIAQFLSFISMLDMGVTAVIDANLYKPLASGDYDKVNDIFVSANKFFRRIAYIFGLYVFFLILVYPLVVNNYFSFAYTGWLILIISISTFAQYYFGISYRIIINADQRGYIVTVLQGITIILNTFFSVVLIKLNASIHLVKLATSFIYLLQPICFYTYANRRYRINPKKVVHGEPIKQKWNGIAQHVAFIVATRTDTIVLTVFSTLENVSIYGVYNLVISGITSVFDALYIGISPMIGNMLAKDEKEKLNEFFNVYDWLSHYSTTLLFTLCGVLIVPFVNVYTRGVTDANYIRPFFAIILTLAYAIQILRTPYKTIVHAAGHFKQTQTSAIIEAIINLGLSILVVFKYGLVGVAVGTLAAMLYRTLYFVWYLSNNILYRPIIHFIRSVIIDLVSVPLILIPAMFIRYTIDGYLQWCLVALQLGIWGLISTLLLNYVLNRKTIINAFNYLRKKHD